MTILRYFIAACITSAATLASQAQSVARMDNLSAEQKAAATDVTLSGKLSTTGNSDFRQLRDLCWQLQRADLSKADCREIPRNAFHSRHNLREIILPQKAEAIGSQAFFACTSLRDIEIPAAVKRIGAAAFSKCENLTGVVIKGNPVIEPFAFANCPNLVTVVCDSPTPPRISPTAFEGIDVKRSRLVVPQGSERLYRQAPGWRAFYRHILVPRSLRSTAVADPENALIPAPAQMTVDTTLAPLPVNTLWQITAPSSLDNEREHALRMLIERTGRLMDGIKGRTLLKLALDSTLGDREAYTLTVNPEGVEIKGATAAGVFYGIMTLDQLMADDPVTGCCKALPQLTITDYPRTHIRELMVDPVRTFIPFDQLKAFIPEMARFKYNALHLHLVDDQAWRIEIKKYPELTAKGSSRVGMDDMLVPSKGFYTQSQMKELVEYAKRYHVDVIPEIEMPGHEVAAIHVFPKLTCGTKKVPIRTTCGVSNELLCPGEEFVYEFLGNVYKELASVFPSPYIHLGGDEAGNPALDCWTHCPKCQALKKRLGITTTDRSENWKLQKYLFDRCIDTLRTKYNKQPMFWYETDFKDIQEGCVTFAWRVGLTDAAVDAAIRNKARIMLCPGEHCYFDYPMQAGDMPEVNWGMPVTTLKQTYALDPAWGRGEDFEKNNLFGVAGTLWSECINSPERIYYQAYPRALALSEVGWSQKDARSWEGFLRRLRPVLTDMMRRGVSFSIPEEVEKEKALEPRERK